MSVSLSIHPSIHLSIYLYIYLCMSACIHACMYESIYACMYVRMYVCMYLSMYVWLISILILRSKSSYFIALIFYIYIFYNTSMRPRHASVTCSYERSGLPQQIVCLLYIRSKIKSCLRCQLCCFPVQTVVHNWGKLTGVCINSSRDVATAGSSLVRFITWYETPCSCIRRSGKVAKSSVSGLVHRGFTAHLMPQTRAFFFFFFFTTGFNLAFYAMYFVCHMLR